MIEGSVEVTGTGPAGGRHPSGDYWERGWVVVNDVFTHDEVAAVKRLAMDVARAELEGKEGDDADVDLDAQGNRMPRKVMTPFLKDPVFGRFALSRKLRSLLRAIVGAPVFMVSDQIFLKPPRVGSAKPYHQDNAYFRCSPGDEVVTAWIALDDVDAENGCLRYIDGSHRLPVLDHHETAGEKYNLQPAAADIDLSRESLARVRQGGVVVHHSHALHTSHANTSSRWRRAYATHWVTETVTCKVGTLDRAYFATHPELYRDLEQH